MAHGIDDLWWYSHGPNDWGNLHIWNCMEETTSMNQFPMDVHDHSYKRTNIYQCFHMDNLSIRLYRYEYILVYIYVYIIQVYEYLVRMVYQLLVIVYTIYQWKRTGNILAYIEYIRFSLCIQLHGISIHAISIY